MSPRRQAGLSLLELLVVFVLVSMISTVLVQGFGFGLSLYQRVTERSQLHQSELLASAWFRSVNESLVPSKIPGSSLIGDSSEFTAVSMNALLASRGLPEKVVWRLDAGALFYQESLQSLEIAEADNASFAYLDKAGRWHSFWPINESGYELPVAIRLLRGPNNTLTVTLKSRLEPDLLLEEARRERG